MKDIKQTDLPELLAGAGISVECVQAVVLSGDENHIVDGTIDIQRGHPQRLGVKGAVDGAKKQLAKVFLVHTCRRQRVLLQVHAIPRQIEMVG